MFYSYVLRDTVFGWRATRTTTVCSRNPIRNIGQMRDTSNERGRVCSDFMRFSFVVEDTR
jgi:hypothetical protein